MIVEWGQSQIVTIEGNTSASAATGSAADRDGQGVFMRTRRKSEIYAVKNWVED